MTYNPGPAADPRGPTYTEAHRHACEARQVAAWARKHGDAWAREWLAGVQKFRGREAMLRLARDARKVAQADGATA